MTIEGSEVVKQYLANLGRMFHCTSYDDCLVVITPYLDPDNDMISLYISELPGVGVQVSDGGETNANLFVHAAYDLSRSARGRDIAKDIASSNVVDFTGSQLVKTGPVEELGSIMLDVIMAAHGLSHLRYTHLRYKPTHPVLRKQKAAIFTRKLENFLAERNLEHLSSPKLTGQSGQIYNVHYQINGAAYLQSLNPGRSSRAKPLVDRTFGMWADCNDNLGPGQKITLLNDEAFPWKEAHVKRLSQVSTVINWSDRDKLVDLLASRA